MATIRKMRKKWQVLIRRKGCPHVTKTLLTYNDAIKFAQESEDKINKGLFQDLSEAQQTTLAGNEEERIDALDTFFRYVLDQGHRDLKDAKWNRIVRTNDKETKNAGYNSFARQVDVNPI